MSERLQRERISQLHIDELITHGFALVQGFLDQSELEAAQQALSRMFPSAEEFAADKERFRNLNDDYFFPFEEQVLNANTLHPEIISFAERILGMTEIQLCESDVFAKYGGTGEQDQYLHVDYWGKNSLTYPRDEGRYRQLFMILYYSDVTDDLGPTFVVSQEHTRDMFLVPVSYSPAENPELYSHEQAVTVPAGTLVLLTQRTFHRGSAVRASTGARFAHFIGFRAAECTWMQTQGWRTEEGEKRLCGFLEAASPRQREVFGFPRPDDPYWTAEMIEGVSARFPGMDMTPYREALGGA